MKKGTCFSELLESGKQPGVSQIFKLRALPGTNQCSTCCTCSHNCIQKLHSIQTWTARQELCDHMRPDLQKSYIIAYLIFQEIPLLNIQTTIYSFLMLDGHQISTTSRVVL